jgi:hypothetical protein
MTDILQAYYSVSVRLSRIQLEKTTIYCLPRTFAKTPMPWHWPRIIGLAKTSLAVLRPLPKGFEEEESILLKKGRESGEDE